MANANTLPILYTHINEKYTKNAWAQFGLKLYDAQPTLDPKSQK